METTTKICTKCKTEKLITEFNNRSRNKDGKSNDCKECVNKERIEYRKINNERIKEIKRLSYYKNREDINNRRKLDYQENKDKYNKISREYHQNNKEKVLKQKQEYYLKNKERIQEYSKKYRKTFNCKMSFKNTAHKRRLKIKCGDVTTEQLKQLYKNSTNCYWCNKELIKNDTHLDHFMPLSKGGKHTISNLVLSCSKCNLKKGAKDPLEFLLEQKL